MKKNSGDDKAKAESNAKPVDVKLSGNVVLKAKEGCVLPLRYGPNNVMVRVTEKKDVALDWGSLPYESKIMIRRSLKQGHVIHVNKGGN